jgi:hypothetical protein
MTFEQNMNSDIKTSPITMALLSFNCETESRGRCHRDHVGYIFYRSNMLTNTDFSSLYVPFNSRSLCAINSMNSSVRRDTCVGHVYMYQSIIRIVNFNMNGRDIPCGDVC